MTLRLGIDEGTSAVKAILFDAELRPVREARREKPLVHPRAGWVEQDPQVVLDAVLGEVARGRPVTPIVTWQDKRSQEVLDRLEADGRADEVRELSGMPLDPYF